MMEETAAAGTEGDADGGEQGKGRRNEFHISECHRGGSFSAQYTCKKRVCLHCSWAWRRFREAQHTACGAGRGRLPWRSSEGGVLVSTYSLRRRWHVEDDSLASLKPRIKKINADYENLALAA